MSPDAHLELIPVSSTTLSIAALLPLLVYMRSGEGKPTTGKSNTWRGPEIPVYPHKKVKTRTRIILEMVLVGENNK